MTRFASVPSFLALGCVSALAFAGPAAAQDATAPAPGDQPKVLGGMTVTDSAIDAPEVKVEKAESPKYVRPLLDTPQTITVLSNTTLHQQNLLTLREALTTIPGITFGAGEGGGGYGDSINLRGQSANNDIQIDGVRDSAQYSRSDTFNLEQIEVVNGANSVYAGSGSIGGSINLISKRPKSDSLTVLSGGVGTDNYLRGTVDSNVRLNEKIAVRLNAMAHMNDVPSRDFDYYERWGIAPSITYGIDDDTKGTLMYQHQVDKNTPQYGVPYFPAYGGLLPGATYGGYYGYKDYDVQRQTLDRVTALFEHKFSDKVSLRNLTRWQRVKADTYVNPPQGTFCLANGTVANANGPGAAVACSGGQTPGTFYPSGPRGTYRLGDTSIFYEQLDLSAAFRTLGLEHTATLGVSFSQEDYSLEQGNGLRNADGSTTALPPINIANPGILYGGPIHFIPARHDRGDTRNISVYLFDAVKLTDQLEINGGVRWENNRAAFHADTVSTTVGATLGQVTPGAIQQNEDELLSYRVGLVYKPVPNASLYVAYGNSQTPASSSVRLGCGVANALGFSNCTVAPQGAEVYELGGKIDLADGALQLTASLFRNERTNYPVASNDPLIGTLQVLDGRSRVDGITLGASGRITPQWTIFANYSYLDSTVLQSISNYDKTHGVVDGQAGNRLNSVPDHSGSLFTTYQFPFGLQVGYGLTYQGSFNITNNSTAAIYRSKDWLTHRAYIAYNFNNGLSAQVNVQNFTDEKYYTGIRSSLTGWAVPGEGRSAVFTLSYSF